MHWWLGMTKTLSRILAVGGLLVLFASSADASRKVKSPFNRKKAALSHGEKVKAIKAELKPRHGTGFKVGVRQNHWNAVNKGGFRAVGMVLPDITGQPEVDITNTSKTTQLREPIRDKTPHGVKVAKIRETIAARYPGRGFRIWVDGSRFKATTTSEKGKVIDIEGNLNPGDATGPRVSIFKDSGAPPRPWSW